MSWLDESYLNEGFHTTRYDYNSHINVKPYVSIKSPMMIQPSTPSFVPNRTRESFDSTGSTTNSVNPEIIADIIMYMFIMFIIIIVLIAITTRCLVEIEELKQQLSLIKID